MLRSRRNRLVPVGLVMLSGGLILRNRTHGRYSEFAGGFLIAMLMVFIIIIAGIPATLQGHPRNR